LLLVGGPCLQNNAVQRMHCRHGNKDTYGIRK
jgi:hypothetical protein